MSGGGFTADPGALRSRAQHLMTESEGMARLVGSLDGAGRASTGDGGLDGLISRLLDEVKSSVGGAGMALEADGAGLIIDAANYEKADQSSSVYPGP